MQAESELRANKQVIKDNQLAKCREALLPMAMLEPGLVLQSVPKGHSASAKVTHPLAWHLLKPFAVCQLAGHKISTELLHVWLDVRSNDLAAGNGIHQGGSEQHEG